MKTAMAKKEFKAHLPQPSLKDCWRSGPEAGSGGLSKNDCIKRHRRSRSTKTSGGLQKFMSDSGDPTFLETFQEIRIEAATLSGARNDATRKAAKARGRRNGGQQAGSRQRPGRLDRRQTSCSRIVKICVPVSKPGSSKIHYWTTRNTRIQAQRKH